MSDRARIIYNWRCLECGIKGDVAIDFPISARQLGNDVFDRHGREAQKYGRLCQGHDIQIIPAPGKIS